MICNITILIGHVGVCICFAISLMLLFSNNIPIHLKLFPVLLAIQLIVNFIGYKIEGSNHHVYNLFNIICIPYYLFAVWYRYSKGRVRKIGVYSILVFPILAIFNILFLQGFEFYNTYTHSLGAILIVLYSINSLYELFIRTPSSVSPTHVADFWICMGLLICYGVTFVAFNAMQPGIEHPKSVLQVIGIILMLNDYYLYISFSLGFYCALNSQPTKKSTLKPLLSADSSSVLDFRF